MVMELVLSNPWQAVASLIPERSETLRSHTSGAFAYGNTMERKWLHMSDFELLSIVLGFLGILVSVLVAYVNSLK